MREHDTINTAYSHRLTFIPTPADLIIITAFFPVTTQLNIVLNSFGVSIYKSEAHLLVLNRE